MSAIPEIELQPNCFKIHHLPTIAYQLVHATDGRFRFHIPRLTHSSNYAKYLEQLVKSLEFVTQVRVNLLSGSLIVNYATDRISMLSAKTELVEAIQQTSQVIISPKIPPSFERAVIAEDFTSPKHLLSANILTIKPPQDKMFWLTWLGIYPLITGISFVFEPWLILLSLPMRTLLLSGVIVLLMTYIVMPMLTELSRDWLYAN